MSILATQGCCCNPCRMLYNTGRPVTVTFSGVTFGGCIPDGGTSVQMSGVVNGSFVLPGGTSNASTSWIIDDPASPYFTENIWLSDNACSGSPDITGNDFLFIELLCNVSLNGGWSIQCGDGPWFAGSSPSIYTPATNVYTHYGQGGDPNDPNSFVYGYGGTCTLSW